jgi:hypothetical protein
MTWMKNRGESPVQRKLKHRSTNSLGTRLTRLNGWLIRKTPIKKMEDLGVPPNPKPPQRPEPENMGQKRL